MRVVGVDENGLGPMLGPLTSTAVLVEVAEYDAKKLRRKGRSVGVADSKQAAAFGDMAHCEGIALAIVERVTGRVPADVDALLEAVAEGGVTALRAPCPTDTRTRDHCWEPLALPAWGGSVAAGRKALDKLEKAGVTLRLARTVVSCVGRLNAHAEKGRNKLFVNLHAFERLVLAAREAAGDDVLALCGMIGGLRFYSDRFAHFPLSAIVEEAKLVSRYHVPGVGDVRFVVDADDAHLPVALASMLGKYVRELLVERQTRFYQGHAPELPSASGYHDAVTKRFVRESEPLRKRLLIADECFQRRG